MQNKIPALKGIKNILVSVESKYDDVLFTYKDGSGKETKFYKMMDVGINWDVSVVGKSICDYPNLKIKTGDDVAFSYQVIAEKEWKSSTEIFKLSVHTDGQYSEWSNGAGSILRKVKAPFGKQWNAFLMDSKNNLVSSQIGNEDEVERWLSQFNFSENNGSFKYLMHLDGKEYWRVKHDHIIAKKRGNDIIVYHDMLLLKRVLIDLSNSVGIEKGIILPEKSIQLEYPNMGMLVNDYNKLGLKRGDIVAFEDRYSQSYKLWGTNYILLKESRVLGKFD